MALKSTNGRQNHRALSGLCVCCEQRALKSTGERNTRNQVGAGTFGLRETACTPGDFESEHIWHPAAIWRRGVSPAGKLLTAVLGERLRRSQLAALVTS
jgi:hypothetical protein